MIGWFFNVNINVSDQFQLSQDVNITVALNLIDLKRYEEARRVLTELNQIEPDAEAYYLLYKIAQLENDSDRMELAIQKATVHDPANSRYHLLFSQLLVRLKKYETAEKAAKGQGGQFVEVKLNDVKIEFNKVRRENDGSHTEDPKAGGSSEEKIWKTHSAFAKK